MNIDAALARAQRDYAALPEWQQTATGGGMKPPECIHDSERRDLARKFIVCPLCLSERMAHLEAENDALRQEREALKDRGDLWQKAAESYMADLALARAVLRDASEVLGDIEVTMTTEDEYALVEVLRAAWQRWQKARRD